MAASDEERRREKTVDDGGPEQCPYGINSCKIDQHAEQRRDGDQTVEFLGPVGMLVKTMLPSESLGDSVGA